MMKLHIRNRVRRAGWPVLFCAAACMAVPCFALPEAAAAELRPFVLPSQARAENRSGPQAAPAVDPQVYRDFEAKVRSLSPAERQQLFRGIEEKHEDAHKRQRPAEAAYYEKLIAILASRP